MPNERGSARPGDLERAHPFSPGRFDEAEPQEARGAVGSRGRNAAPGTQASPAGPSRGRGQHHDATEWSGVNPLGPIDPSMPVMKPGDQAG
jgi:hypothetical protein